MGNRLYRFLELQSTGSNAVAHHLAFCVMTLSKLFTRSYLVRVWKMELAFSFFQDLIESA